MKSTADWFILGYIVVWGSLILWVIAIFSNCMKLWQQDLERRRKALDGDNSVEDVDN